MAQTTDPKELSFGAAMTELESILRRVEGDEIDIDELAVELQRAALLLETCREKIRRAEVEVSQIVQTLDPPTAEGAAAESGESETASLFPTED